MKSRRETEKIIIELTEKYNNNIPDEIWNMSGNLNVKLQFDSINFFGMCYPQQEVYGLDRNIYDLSLLDPFYDGTLNLHDIWDKEKICPNPRMCEVENSNLKEKLYITNDAIKHWLIVGHEEEIHILSKSFTWCEIK